MSAKQKEAIAVITRWLEAERTYKITSSHLLDFLQDGAIYCTAAGQDMSGATVCTVIHKTDTDAIALCSGQIADMTPNDVLLLENVDIPKL